MHRSVAKALTVLNYVIMFVLALIFGERQSAVTLIMLGGVVIAVILSQFLRCPSCGRGQGRGQFFAQYCPYCGEPLDD